MRCIAILLIIILPIAVIFSDYIVSDDMMKSLQSGENVYIYNTVGLQGFTVEYDKKMYVDGGILRDEGNRILLGRLREDVPPGTTDTIILNTVEGIYYLELRVSPVFSDIVLEKKTVNPDSVLSGEIFFKFKNKKTTAGVDSVKILLGSYGVDFFDNFSVYSVDDLSEASADQSIRFEFSAPKSERDYTISLICFSGVLCDTVYFAEGFSTKSKTSEMNNLLLIDSRSKLTTDNLFERYDDMLFDNLLTFYSDMDTSIFQMKRDGIVVFVSVDGGKVFSDIDMLTKLQELSDSVPVFIFAQGLCKFISQEENRGLKNYIEMMFDINCTNMLRFNNEKEDIVLSIPESEIELVEDKRDDEKITSYAINGNLFLFFYLPAEIDIDELNSIYFNSVNIKLKERLGKLSSVVLIQCENYGEYSIEIYNLSGIFQKKIILSEISNGSNYIRVNTILKKDGSFKTGSYFFKIKKDEQCIQDGRVYFISD